MKGYVFVTGYGLLKFKGKKEKLYLDGTEQHKGSIRLPKGIKTGGGKKWMKLDYWFKKDEIYETPTDAINEMIYRCGYTGYGSVTAESQSYQIEPNLSGHGSTTNLPDQEYSNTKASINEDGSIDQAKCEPNPETIKAFKETEDPDSLESYDNFNKIIVKAAREDDMVSVHIDTYNGLWREAESWKNKYHDLKKSYDELEKNYYVAKTAEELYEVTKERYNIAKLKYTQLEAEMVQESDIKIYMTYDYDLFKFFDTNRRPDHWEAIANSIDKENLTMYEPIFVTNDYEVLDGQNRFYACKDRGLPIYFIKPHEDDKERISEKIIPLLNSHQKNWSLEDFMNYYIRKDYEGYKDVRTIQNQTSFTINTILRLWPYQSTVNKSTRQGFKDGEYKINHKGKEKISNVYSIIKKIEKHKPVLVDLTNKNRLVIGLNSCLNNGAAIEQLIEQIEKYGYLIQKCGSSEQYIDMIENIYNHKKHNKVSLKYRSRSAVSTTQPQREVFSNKVQAQTA